MLISLSVEQAPTHSVLSLSSDSDSSYNGTSSMQNNYGEPSPSNSPQFPEQDKKTVLSESGIKSLFNHFQRKLSKSQQKVDYILPKRRKQIHRGLAIKIYLYYVFFDDNVGSGDNSKVTTTKTTSENLMEPRVSISVPSLLGSSSICLLPYRYRNSQTSSSRLPFDG